MKKTLLVLALAVVLVLAFANSAFAWSPKPGYIAWSAAGVNSNGPHADYQTSTTKCAVCHAVHLAPEAGYAGTTGGVAWTATGPTQLMLRSSVADSCRFCHIDTAIGGIQLYGGTAGIYTVWTGPGHAGTGNSACVNCHSVHGANTFLGANTSKILKLAVNESDLVPHTPQADILGGAGATAGLFPDFATAKVADGAGAMKYQQQAVFCSECHTNFSRSADTSINTGFALLGKSHSMVSAPSASFSATSGGPATQYNAGGGVLSSAPTLNSGATLDSSTNTQIATAGSGTCRACHTAGGVNQSGVSFNSFPHYTRGMPYFLTNGSVAATTTDLIGNNSGTDLNHDSDGNCKLCHTGVGTMF